jgi:hypothetical protein
MENFHIFQALLNQLVEQSSIAMLAVPLARAEMETQRERIVAAGKGGKAREKRSRATVQRLFQARLRQGLDPRDLVSEFAREYGYSKRQLRNILRQVKAGTP